MHILSNITVPNLNLIEPRLVVCVNVDVDRKMSVHVAHLVLEALCHAGYEILDERLYGA